MKDPKREETPEIRSKSFRTPYTKTQPEVTFAINPYHFVENSFVGNVIKKRLYNQSVRET